MTHKYRLLNANQNRIMNTVFISKSFTHKLLHRAASSVWLSTQLLYESSMTQGETSIFLLNRFSLNPPGSGWSCPIWPTSVSRCWRFLASLSGCRFPMTSTCAWRSCCCSAQVRRVQLRAAGLLQTFCYHVLGCDYVNVKYNYSSPVLCMDARSWC